MQINPEKFASKIVSYYQFSIWADISRGDEFYGQKTRVLYLYIRHVKYEKCAGKINGGTWYLGIVRCGAKFSLLRRIH